MKIIKKLILSIGDVVVTNVNSKFQMTFNLGEQFLLVWNFVCRPIYIMPLFLRMSHHLEMMFYTHAS